MRRLYLFIFFGCFLLFLKANASLPQTVHVQLFQAYPSPQQIDLQGEFKIASSAVYTGTHRIEVINHHLVLEKVIHRNIKNQINLANQFVIESTTPQGIGIQYPHHPTRFYPGHITIYIDKQNQLRLINQVPTSLYIMSVVGSETLPGWPLEALKAQAVLAQTNLARQHRHTPLPDSTQFQDYQGLAPIRPDIRRAVNAVHGQILTYHNRPIQALFHSTCAGGTSDGNYFTGSHTLPYLHPVPCKFCTHSPFYHPHITTIPLKTFQHTFGPGLPKIIQSDSAHRPLKIRLGNGRVISGYQFWLSLGQHFGWDKAPGTRFWFVYKPGIVQVSSTGAGHGVGLCQWGAAGLAQQGKSYQEILNYYFYGIKLEPKND